MRLLATAILTISLAAASSARADDAAEPKQAEATAKQTAETKQAPETKQSEAKKQEKKASRGKRFLRSVGSFSAGMLVTDPYNDAESAKKSAR
jgi:hypothetical protein